MPIYLDYNATTPVDERVFQKMVPYFTKKFGNASSSSHSFGWDAQEAVEDARGEVARLINSKPVDIVFTSGATESVNLAIKGIASQYRNKGNHIITSAIEHPCVLETCKRLAESGFEITYLAVDNEGHIDVEQLEEKIRDQTILISLMYANNEIGTISPASHFAEVAHKHGVFF